VGGSAAGLFTAATVAAGGRCVRVLESRQGFEPAARSLIVTDQFRSQLGAVASESIVNEIRRFELFTDGRSAQVSLARPDLIIERSRLIPALARSAQQAGAKLSFDTRFLGLAPNARGLRVEVDSAGRREELHAESVVGADGASSRVARSAGWPPIETVPLVQAIVRLPKDHPPDTTRVWFVPDDTPYFYWLIPESSERGALGIIGEQGPDTKRCLACFLEKRHLEPLEWQGARIPVYRGWVPVRRRVGKGEVYLVGDAAAQVKVSTVGGIVTGLRGALGVGQSILQKGGSKELTALRRELGPQAELYLLIGSDQYGKLGEWRAADEVARLARVAVFERPGYKIADRSVLKVPMPPMLDAASDIRAHGARQSLPPAVANYIERKGLYR